MEFLTTLSRTTFQLPPVNHSSVRKITKNHYHYGGSRLHNTTGYLSLFLMRFSFSYVIRICKNIFLQFQCTFRFRCHIFKILCQNTSETFKILYFIDFDISKSEFLSSKFSLTYKYIFCLLTVDG